MIRFHFFIETQPTKPYIFGYLTSWPTKLFKQTRQKMYLANCKIQDGRQLKTKTLLRQVCNYFCKKVKSFPYNL